LRAPWSEVTKVCLTPPPEPAGTRPNGENCRVQSILPLGDIADTAWFVTRYRRSVRFRSEGVVDSISYDELALVGRPPGSGDGVFRWHLRRERDIEFLDSVTVTPGAAGVFLEFQVCLNGTGGCSREYLLHRGGRWQPVAQPYVAALARHLPAGYQLHKGQRLDLRTLRGVWPVAQPGDANCCPSYEIAFRVRLRGSTVELESVAPLRVIPGPPDAGSSPIRSGGPRG
jgi:hypothetical protein